MTKSALILAAGLGTRMRPLTDDRPKPMVEVCGKPIISYILDMVKRAGCNNIVMNIHYKPEKLLDYTKINHPEILISDETDNLLDSGGGIVKALSKIENEDFFVINADCIWLGSNPLIDMNNFYKKETMDIVKLLFPAQKAIGFDEVNIYSLNEGHIIREQKSASHSFTGVSLLKKSLFKDYNVEAFSVRKIWDKVFSEKRIFGIEHNGDWLHIGTPEGVKQAEVFLQS